MEQSLKFSQYGSDNGQLVIYFHGTSGATEECAIFDSHAKANNLTFICFNRFSVDASIVGETYCKRNFKEKCRDIIGFSIGAFVALQTCRYRSHIEIVDGLSHYSCLYEIAAKICNHLGGENHEKTSD